MKIIYKPRGRALEYSPLACNLFTGCIHKCSYCYCSNILKQTKEKFHKGIVVKDNALEKLEKEAFKIKGDNRDILFSFLSDPYQNEQSAKIMGDALLICDKYNLKVQVLTKNGEKASKDFDLLKKNNWKFGSTIIFTDEKYRETFEPNAPCLKNRIDAVKLAHNMGIYTWISIEPVIEPLQALNVVKELKGFVDLWKIGKINHDKNLEKSINWKEFLFKMLQSLNGECVYWKADLLENIF